MREILQRLKIEPAFQKINQVRIELTTSTAPYLRAVKDDKANKLDQLKEASWRKFKSSRRKTQRV